MINIRLATKSDHDEVWHITKKVISSGDTLVFHPDSSKEKMLAYWFNNNQHTYVAAIDNQIVGTFFLRDNQPDLGSHIANAGYITDTSASGQGIGKAMGEFSMTEARRLGYKAMQFNIVVKSNEKAVRLWQRLGFKIIGEIPDAFDHKQNGLTNAFIMYQRL